MAIRTTPANPQSTSMGRLSVRGPNNPVGATRGISRRKKPTVAGFAKTIRYPGPKRVSAKGTMRTNRKRRR